MIAEIFLFALGAAFSTWWFSVTLLPLFYGLPKTIYWSSRGLLRWASLINFLVPPILWNSVFGGISVVLVIWFQSWAEALMQSAGFHIGQFLALAGSIWYAFTPEGRRDLKSDFIDVATRYIISEDPLLLGEFGYKHKIHELVKPEA